MARKTFKDWYLVNKDKLSEKRKERYKEDADYRQRAIERSSQRRSALASLKGTNTGYTVAETCYTLEISLWTINRWRTENYFPVQSLRGYRFTENQIQLLGLLKEFFSKYPKRTLSRMQSELDSLVGVIHHNWS